MNREERDLFAALIAAETELAAQRKMYGDNVEDIYSSIRERNKRHPYCEEVVRQVGEVIEPKTFKTFKPGSIGIEVK